ncbi:hypothetical protein ASF58_18990 [Methylobacterium sp. Leaf125]|uniref:ABC-three component system protein n=1 Tax=Methylobacterium sp. Leaf125 TaxID=1736265 RepID=UPI0006F25862|nr:ABC-three component system protein [Methylobacterium sp. Leaf125]KQQ45664.1 hypothetical protein ASF58_18990 [Methylobacterium sp. Leaf125]
MISLAIRLKELDDEDLEEFIELFADRIGRNYHGVYRMGQANDKGRDVVGFMTSAKHEGPWHLYQCKRKTKGSALGLPEALVELGKLFHHHLGGAYATLPTEYIFVAPRGVAGPLRDLILNPSKLKAKLLDEWDDHCLKGITARGGIKTPLTPQLRAAIEGYDFGQIEYLASPGIVKHAAAGPALTKVLGVLPGDAPAGVAPVALQPEEIRYIDQLRRAYGEARGATFATVEAVLSDSEFGPDLGDQRTRFFEASVFKRFHRDNTHPAALAAFETEIYHGVIGLHRRRHPTGFERLCAVMDHASIMPAAIGGKLARGPVRQGVCHHLANEGTMKWMP